MNQPASPQSHSEHGVPKYNRAIHRLAKFVVVWALLVICLGGKTKSKEAGLTIPQPVIFSWVPEWLTTENISAEYSHRIVAFLLTCSALALMCLVLSSDVRTGVRTLAISLVGAIVAQAALGALTVYYLAAAKSSIPHAVLAQITFCLAASLAVVTSPAWMSDAKPVVSDEKPTLLRLSKALVIAFFVQLLLGSALRHDGMAEALRNGHAIVFWSHLIAHIMGAMAVTFFLARVLMRVFRMHREQKEIMSPARWIMMLLALQLCLGMGAAVLKVMTKDYESANSPPALRVWVATAHVATGAVMFAFSVVLALNAYRFATPNAQWRDLASHPTSDGLGVPA